MPPVSLRLFLAMAALCAALAGCQTETLDRTGVSESSRNAPLKVETIQAMLATQVSENAVYFGKIVPSRQANLAFSMGGTVAEVYREIGQTAATGDVLARLNQGSLAEQIGDLETAIAEDQRIDASGGQTSSRRLQRETQLADLKRQQAAGTIVAPYDCVIVQQQVSAGSVAVPNRPVLLVYENGPPNVLASLPRKIADRIEVGRATKIVVSDQLVWTKVKSKSPFQSAAGSVELSLVAETEMPGLWQFGQPTEIRFNLPTEKSGFWLPTNAVLREPSGLWSVFVVQQTGSGAVAKRVIVTIEQFEDARVLVAGAIENGDSIVVSGVQRIVAGQAVQSVDVTGVETADGTNADRPVAEASP